MEFIENKTDEELCELAQNGDSFCAEVLLRRYKNLVNKCCRSYFLIGAEEEDLIQEGMIGLYKATLKFRWQDGNKFMTYAYSCIKNNIFDAMKNATRNKHLPLNNYAAINGEGIQATTPEDIAIKEEDFEEKLLKVQKILSKKEQEVFNLYLDGLNMLEIATVLKGEMKMVDNALQRIKNKIKQEL